MNSISLNEGSNTQNLRPVDPLSILPIDGDGRDAVVQRIICNNRQTYIPVRLKKQNPEFNDNGLAIREFIHLLEFIPSGDVNYVVDSDFRTYKLDVYLTIDNANKPNEKIFLLTMDCIGSTSWLNSGDVSYDSITQIKYHFKDGVDIYSERFFTLSDEDKKYLIENFTEKYVIIAAINYYLTNTITSSYNLSNYSLSDFLVLSELAGVEINEDYRNIINVLLSKKEDNKAYHHEFKPYEFSNRINMLSGTTIIGNSVTLVSNNNDFSVVSNGIFAGDVESSVPADNFVNKEKTNDFKQNNSISVPISISRYEDLHNDNNDGGINEF